MLLHLGQRGSASESMTYMRQRGHPTSTIDVASGLLEYFRLSSDDTHDRGGDGDGDDDDDSSALPLTGPARFSFNSTS